MELPDLTKMSQQDFFNWLDDQLGEGWSCGLISTLTPGIVRLQLLDDGEEELGWRKCVEALSLKEAVQEAIDFTHSTTVEQYQNWYFDNMAEEEYDPEP